MVWVAAVISVLLVSLASFIGVLSLGLRPALLRKVLPLMVAFAAGALLGNAFFHMLPETVEEAGFGIKVGLGILFGMLFSFALEKIVHWHHCHRSDEKHVHPVGYLNLIGEGMHNLLDGLVIGAAYFVSFEVGVATTVAVLLHEIPQELGDFAVLVHAGFSKAKALLFNFVSPLAAFIGLGIAFAVSNAEAVSLFILPFAAGNFIYMALVDIVPELHKETRIRSSLVQLFALVAGAAAMGLLVLLE